MKGKVRNRKKKDQEGILMEKRRQLMMFLKSCSCPKIKNQVSADLEKIEAYLSKVFGAQNASIVKEHIKSVELTDGKFNNHNFWKLKGKLWKKTVDPPIAKRDTLGNLITAPEALKSLYSETYRMRLSNREMKEELKDIFTLKEELWSSRMKELLNRKSEEWSVNELRTALKRLKSNKAVDPNLMVNELFKEGYIGQDLENAILLLCNGIKDNLFVPEFMLRQNITTIFKNKGSRLDMKNDRGIFLLTSLRRIIDNLLYQDLYNDIDANMSDSNVGARSGRQVKNHLFIVHGVINSVINGKEACIDLQLYDLEQAFDALWLSDCMIDIFDTIPSGHRDEKLGLLYKLSEENLVAVNTAHGLTKRMVLSQIVQQGGTWGPVMCSNSIDTIGKKLWRRGQSCYLYKNVVNILPLAMVDDICAISKCGFDSLLLNTYINSQIELKKLRFHVPDSHGKTKCHKLHIGNKNGHCPHLKVHGTLIEEVTEDVYLGDVISNDGKNKKNLQKRVTRGMGIISQITNLLAIVSYGYHYVEIALLLREAMFVSSVLNNVEVWYGVSRKEVETFEKMDLILLRKILKTPMSTPKEAIYLELGILPLGVLLKEKRVNYLHYLITRNSQEMLSKFFWVQWSDPGTNDWTETVRQDLADFGMSADPEIIKKYSKYSYKKQVKERAREFAFSKLLELKNSHSKMRLVSYPEFKLQSYFTLPETNIDEIRSAFSFRIHMSNFAENFRSAASASSLCPLCNMHSDSQCKITQCKVIKDNFKGSIQHELSNIYSHNIVISSVRKLHSVIKFRDKFMEEIKKQ